MVWFLNDEDLSEAVVVASNLLGVEVRWDVVDGSFVLEAWQDPEQDQAIGPSSVGNADIRKFREVVAGAKVLLICVSLEKKFPTLRQQKQTF